MLGIPVDLVRREWMPDVVSAVLVRLRCFEPPPCLAAARKSTALRTPPEGPLRLPDPLAPASEAVIQVMQASDEPVHHRVEGEEKNLACAVLYPRGLQLRSGMSNDRTSWVTSSRKSLSGLAVWVRRWP